MTAQPKSLNPKFPVLPLTLTQFSLSGGDGSDRDVTDQPDLGNNASVTGLRSTSASPRLSPLMRSTTPRATITSISRNGSTISRTQSL